MARTMKAVDAVMVGMGWSGSIMARELTKAGLTVVGLERGADKSPRENFALPGIRDEIKYRVRQELMLDTSIETHTLRNNPSELALPDAQMGRPADGRRAGRRRRALERRHLALLAERVRAAQPSHAALRPQRHPGGDDDPGLGHHLRRSRAPLRSFRAAVRHLRQGRQSARPDGRGRQSVRGRAPERVSQQAADHVAGRLDLHQGGGEPRLSSVPDPGLELQRPLCQFRGTADRPVPILRALRIFRLRIQRQGEPAHLRAAGADAGCEIRAAHPGLCQAAHLRQGGQEGARRRLCGPPQRRGDRAARRSRHAVRLSVQQHAAAAHRRHRRALRSGDRQGRGRQELLPPDHLERDDVRRGRDQSVDRHRRVAGGDRRFPGRQFRPWRARLLRRRLHLPLRQRRAPDPGARRSARHAALGLGLEGSDRALVQRTASRSTATASATPTATTIWISIRPTRMRSAAR